MIELQWLSASFERRVLTIEKGELEKWVEIIALVGGFNVQYFEWRGQC